MELTQPIPFREAIRRQAVRAVMPTSMGSDELQRLNADILRASFFSARTLLEDYLRRAKQVIGELLAPRRVTRIDEQLGVEVTVTEGLNLAYARSELQALLDRLGYVPEEEQAGTIQDLRSDARVNLVLRTNLQIAQGYGWWRQGMDPGVIEAFPAMEMVRVQGVKEPRNWRVRWDAAARTVRDWSAMRAAADHGRMAARKDSPLWQALGDGAGGFESDALHNPYPPFAFNSGMDVQDVTYQDAVAIGLIEPGQTVTPQLQPFAENLAA